MNKVEHRGIVESIEGHRMNVRILQVTACSSCHANTLCTSSEKVEKIIQINYFNGVYLIGQAVTIIGKSGSGLQAVFLAYVLPLFFLIGGIFLFGKFLFSGNEGLTAIFSLLITALYYVILYLFRKSLSGRFSFSVKPENESIELSHL